MTRLVDAEHLIRKAEQEKKDGLLENDELETIYYELSDEPTVDAVPVIRCKYCTYQSSAIDGQKVCMLPNGYTPLGYDEGFCSMAERKKMG